MVLYYYITTNLSRINIKKNPSGGKRDVYITIYIEKIQPTIWGKEKEKDVYYCIYIERNTYRQNAI